MRPLCPFKALLYFAKSGGAFFIIARIPADRSQSVWREGDEIFEREATRYVLDIGIESAVFVNDEHDRHFPTLYRAGQIAFDRAISGRRLHVKLRTVCVHSDTPGAVKIARLASATLRD